MEDSFKDGQAALWRFALMFEEIREHYDGNIEPTEERVLNALQCWALFFHDFSVLTQETYRGPMERSAVFARLLAMSIYEAFEDMSELLGNRLYSDMKTVGVPLLACEQFDAVRVKLRALRARHENELHDIRHMVTAHRDREARKQWAVIQRLDVNYVQGLAVELTKWSYEVLDALMPLVTHVADRIVARGGRFDRAKLTGK